MTVKKIPESDVIVKSGGVRKIPESDIIGRSDGIDRESGAPANVRALAGNIPVENQVETVRQFFPDAQPFEDNIIFTSPETGRLTLFNPKGLDVGDVAQHARAFFETAGGAFGGGLALLAGQVPPLTLVPDELATVPVGVGLGSAMGGQVYDRVQEGLGRVDPREMLNRFTEATADVLLNAAIPKVFEKISSGTKGLIEKTLGPLKNLRAQAGGRQLLEDFAQEGIRPSAGAVSGSRIVQGSEKFLAGTPTGGRTLQQATTETIQGTADFAKRSAEMFGPIKTPQGLGGTLRPAADKAIDQLKLIVRNKEKAFNIRFGENSPIAITNTVGKIREILEQFKAAPSLGEDINRGMIELLEKILSDAGESGSLPFTALRALRTELGATAKNPLTAPVRDVASGKASAIYGAITQDIKAAADAKSPQLLKEFEDLLELERNIFNKEFPFLEKIVKTGFDEDAYKAMLTASKDGGSRLSVLRRNMKAEEWDEVAGTVLGRMGLSTPGAQNVSGDAFSVSTFLTNWNKLAPEAKTVLFGGQRYKPLRTQLDRLVRVTGALKDVESVANTSNTGLINNLRQAMFAPIVGGALGNLKGAAVALGGQIVLPFASAKLITNPAFVRWLANGAKITAEKDPLKMRTLLLGHLGRLAVIAEAEPEIKDELRQYEAMVRPAIRAADNRSDLDPKKLDKYKQLRQQGAVPKVAAEVLGIQ